jgi:hypothetical protein
MSYQPSIQDRQALARSIPLIGASMGGVLFMLGAVPLLYGGSGNWFGAVLQASIGFFVAAATRWFLGPIPSKPSKHMVASARRPVVNALMGGVLVATVVLATELVFPMAVPAVAAFPAALTLALGLGAWAALMSYLSFKYISPLSLALTADPSLR